MAIKGLSDRRRITRGGYIRLGKKATNAKGQEYPVKSDHFIADFDDAALQTRFVELYGEKPTRIPIAFPSDDENEFFSQFYKAYGSSTGLKCKGDGEAAQRVVEGEMVDVDCPGPEECEYAKQNGCKPIGSLQFFVRGLNVLQIFQINTSSYNSIVNVNSGIDLLRFARGGKSIAGVWVNLVLKPQEAQVDGKKVHIFVLEVEIPVGLDDVQRLTSAVEAPVALPAPSDERDEYLYPQHGFAPAGEPLVDAVTGEVLNDEPEPARLEDDPDVIRAFDQAGVNGAKHAAMLNSAAQNGWTKDKLLEVIFQNRADTNASTNTRSSKRAESKHPTSTAPQARQAPPASRKTDPLDDADF